MKDLDVLVIHYDGEHDYTYKTPVAMQVVQDIKSRLDVDRNTVKKKLTYDIALKYQEKVVSGA